MIKKIFLWLVLGYILAYLCLSILLTYHEGFELGLYGEFLPISFSIFILLIPFLLLSIAIWRWLNRKYPTLDETWWKFGLFLIVLSFLAERLAFFLIIYAVAVASLMPLEFQFNVELFILTFPPIFLGLLLPRILIKSLRPGNLFKV